MSASTGIFSNLGFGKGLPRPRFSSKESSVLSMVKDPIILPVGDTALLDLDEDPDWVQCIICEDKVSIQVLEIHRQNCKVSCQVDLTSENTLETVTKNIKKFRGLLKGQERKELDLNSLVTLDRNSDDLLINSPDKYSVTQKVIDNLQDFSMNFRGKHTSKVHVERLINLAKDQLRVLQYISINEKQQQILQIANKEPEKPSWHNNAMKIDFQMIDKISSNVKTKYIQSGQFSETIIDEGPLENLQESLDLPVEDLKKSFLLQCIEVKFELPTNHPGQTVKATDLYTKAQGRNLDSGTWKDFIRTELNNSANWLSQNSVLRRPLIKKKQFAVNCIIKEEVEY